MRTLTVAGRGVDLHVTEAGDPASTRAPLLLLHGYTGSTLDWYDVQPALAEDRLVVGVDHRGHGDSTNLGTAAAYCFDAVVDDVTRLVDTLVLDRFHLLGHSLGGVIAMRWALEHQDRLRSLVLMDTAPAPTGGLPREILDVLVTTGRTAGMAAVAELVVGSLPAGASDAARERARRKFTTLDVEALAGFADELETYPDLMPRLPAIAVPTTVLCGAADALLGPSRRMAAVIPGAHLVVIAGAGHSPQEDRPQAWLDAVRSHLARAESEAVASR